LKVVIYLVNLGKEKLGYESWCCNLWRFKISYENIRNQFYFFDVLEEKLIENLRRSIEIQDCSWKYQKSILFFDVSFMKSWWTCVDRNVSQENYGFFTEIIEWVREKCEREFSMFFDEQCVDRWRGKKRVGRIMDWLAKYRLAKNKFHEELRNIRKFRCWEGKFC